MTIKKNNIFLSKRKVKLFVENKQKVGSKFLEVLAQLTNVEIARPDVVTRVRTRNLTVVCRFNFQWITTSSKTKKISIS